MPSPLVKVKVVPLCATLIPLFKNLLVFVSPVPPLSVGTSVSKIPALVSPVAILPSVSSVGLEPILLPHVAPTVAPSV